MIDNGKPGFVGCESSLEYLKHLAIYAQCAACPVLANISSPANAYIDKMKTIQYLV